MIPATRRERYLKQSLPIRLGGLAADIARVSSFTTIPDVRAVETMLEVAHLSNGARPICYLIASMTPRVSWISNAA